MADSKSSNPKPAPLAGPTDSPRPHEPESVGPPVASTEFPVVGMVASAGGLEAFKKFFQAMPPNSGMVFILIPHLDPRHESLMPELVSKHTSMPVAEATEGARIAPNHVYVLPPNRYLAIRGGELRLSGPIEPGRPQTSIDFFLRSLAEDQQEKAICIVLSGTGSHGTLGLKAIKANGGLAMVQEPGTAEYDQMPRSAIATGLADYVLPVEKMPEALLKYVRHVFATPESADVTDAIAQVLALLRARSKFDFRSYRKRLLHRRIQRRVGLNHLDRFSDYVALLRERPEEIDRLCRDLLISVTRFFRDREMFQILETQVIPELLRRKTREDSFRVWVAGCATGEEAYSIAMLVIEQLTAAEKNGPLQVFATDVDRDGLDAARRGLYSESVMADVGPERIVRFFAKTDAQSYQVNKSLRETVLFAPQNLLSDAPFSHLDLISCRNLLIYLEPEIQRKVLLLLHFALNEGGYLVLGPSETIGPYAGLFESVSRKWRIYRRIGTLPSERLEFPIAGDPIQAAPPAAAVHPYSLADITRRLLLDEYTPAAVVINRNGEVLYFHGDTAGYLQQPSGTPTQDLNTLAYPGLKSGLRAVIQEALQDNRRISRCGGHVRRQPGSVPVRITAQPMRVPRVNAGLLLVTFEDETLPNLEAISNDELLARQLDYELRTARDELQSTIEELESSNEELKASNEEIMSMNEELQSTNEELETSKEELQSLNEELSTVNSQLQEKIGEVEVANTDMANLLDSADIATVFLDPDRRIKRFTPAATRLFNLIATDVGRPFGDITARFTDPDLNAHLDSVLQDLSPREKEVACAAGHWYIRRITPYRTFDHRTEGTVITFTDVTPLKLGEQDLRSRTQELEQRVVQRTRELETEALERRRAEEQARARAMELSHVHRLYTAGEMATAIAHELGQPLSAIASYGEASLRTLQRGEIDKRKLASNLERISAQAQRAGRIIRELRGFLSKEEGARIPVGINLLVRSTVELVEIEAREHGVKIGLDLSEGLSPVLAQPIQVEHVLVNLLHNAVDAMTEASATPGTITIATRAENPEMVRVTVQDEGPGLDGLALKHLFDPFYTTKARGLGMGLAISRTIIEAHGGRIWAEAGQGGLFHFTLPLAP